jgi:hypothetical protein
MRDPYRAAYNGYMNPDDALALALGYLGRARLAMKRTGGGRTERAFLLQEARKMVERARQAMATLDVSTMTDGPAARELFEDVEAQVTKAEKDLARED